MPASRRKQRGLRAFLCLLENVPTRTPSKKPDALDQAIRQDINRGFPGVGHAKKYDGAMTKR